MYESDQIVALPFLWEELKPGVWPKPVIEVNKFAEE